MSIQVAFIGVPTSRYMVDGLSFQMFLQTVDQWAGLPQSSTIGCLQRGVQVFKIFKML